MSAPAGLRGGSGKVGRICFHDVILPAEAGSKILVISASVRSFSQVFLVETASTMASSATGISVTWMPAFTQIFDSSLLIGRDAPARSATPLHRSFNPGEVPVSRSYGL